jgi:ribosomal-protein-alanine N-acetyltransferase
MLQINFTPFPELSTQRLILRKLTLEDAADVFFLRSEQAILQFLSKEPVADIKEAEDFITRINNDIDNNHSIMWAIVLKENLSKVVGTICYWRILKEHYRAEIGYVLNPKYWRKGIMKETIFKVLDYGFSTMGFHSIEARINPDNIASAALLESAGFIREAYFKEDFYHRGLFEDTAVYSRLNK